MLQLSKQLFEKVSVVVELGFPVLILEEDVYIYSTFEASTSSNVSSIDFCTAKVICITDFIVQTQISELVNRKEFKHKLTNKIDSLGDPIRINFNKYMHYLTFSK